MELLVILFLSKLYAHINIFKGLNTYIYIYIYIYIYTYPNFIFCSVSDIISAIPFVSRHVYFNRNFVEVIT